MALVVEPDALANMGKGNGNMLAFDNLKKQVSDGVIKDTTHWEERSIILDVPMPADRLHFGF